MPIRAPAGKPPGQAVNRHPRLEFVEVPRRPRPPARRLPQRRVSAGPTRTDRRGHPVRDAQPTDWPEGAVETWTNWSRMPHTTLWSETDWQFAVESLHVAAMAIESPDPRWYTELRQREKIMGTTFDARRDLRIRYVDPPKPDEREVVTLDAYRAI